MSKKQKAWLVAGIVLICLIIDQIIKFYVKLNFTLHQSVEVLGMSWFQICFVENDGMAFGIEWFDKIFLTLFRLIVSGLVIWYIVHMIRKNEVRTGYLVCISLVLAGALGNIIDCLFYGLIFSQSTLSHVATLFPTDGGYASFLYGRVVDMFYFPLIHNAAGEVIFFTPVFNFADSCITVSVFLILLFFTKDLNKSLETKKKEAKS